MIVGAVAADAEFADEAVPVETVPKGNAKIDGVAATVAAEMDNHLVDFDWDRNFYCPAGDLLEDPSC